MITPAFSITATERVLPKLALDFTTAILDSRITFSRADNTATVVNSSGYVTNVNADIPRFDYNPISLVCKGLLIEESRANALSYSEQFEQSTYTKTRVQPFGSGSVVDATISPANTLTADKIVEDATASSTHQISVSKTFVSGTTYTLSIFAKADTRPAISLGFGTTAFPSTRAKFNLTTGVASTETGTPNATISSYGNGWYRCSISVAATSTAADNVIYYINNGTTVSYSGDGTSGIYIWGAQLETGAFATSYISTTLLAVTRNADVATMTGTNFSSWFNATQGSFAFKGDTLATGAARPGIWINKSGGGNGYIQFKMPRPPGTTGVTIQDDAGTVVADLSGSAITVNTAFTTCGGYKVNDFGFADRGAATAVDTAGAVPTGLDRMGIGYDFGTGYQNGHVAAIRFWPQKLTTAEIQAFSKG